MRQNSRKNNIRKNSGFTLMELLIVVAIVVILVAISIPLFTKHLEKTREATDLANIRGEYARLIAEVKGTATIEMNIITSSIGKNP